MDIKSFQSGALAVVTDPASKRSSAHTEAAHIFSPSINKNLDNNDRVLREDFLKGLVVLKSASYLLSLVFH